MSLACTDPLPVHHPTPARFPVSTPAGRGQAFFLAHGRGGCPEPAAVAPSVGGTEHADGEAAGAGGVPLKLGYDDSGEGRWHNMLRRTRALLTLYRRHKPRSVGFGSSNSS